MWSTGVTIVRDLGMLGVGMFIAVYGVTHDSDFMIFLFAWMFMGGPTIANVVWPLLSSLRPGPTESASPSSQSPSSSPPS